ncbi:hypothetical protein BDM02DRAFT_3122303 [Thelephora ganbajun]|uniref:Uncharacterized protein n=1 Tax=Thelephora ganbajun TaxID=370292 RepID=A0ACB6Z4H6_THEGA|nr:hypothetical protein BDM02DRAFT_3122303 [Thelephora ganbajun]
MDPSLPPQDFAMPDLGDENEDPDQDVPPPPDSDKGSSSVSDSGDPPPSDSDEDTLPLPDSSPVCVIACASGAFPTPSPTLQSIPFVIQLNLLPGSIARFVVSPLLALSNFRAVVISTVYPTQYLNPERGRVSLLPPGHPS